MDGNADAGAPTPDASDAGRWRPSPMVWVLAAWLLGAAAAVLRVWSHGTHGQRGALVLGGTTLLFAASLGRVSRWAVRWAGAAVAVGLGLVVGGELLGKATVIVAFASVAVAFAALVRWQPWPSHGRRARATLAVPFLAVAAISWYRVGSISRTTLLVAAAAVVVELYVLAPTVMGRIDAWVERASKALGTAVATAILFLVAVPVLYIPGAIAQLAGRRRRRRDRRASSWVIVAVDTTRQRRDAPYPFASTPPREAHRRLAAGLVVSLLVSAGAYVVIKEERTAAHSRPARYQRSGPSIGPEYDDPPVVVFGREFAVAYSSLPAYAGQAWADELQEEEATLSGDPNEEGKYITLERGRRVTQAPPPCKGCSKATVWLMGGSAAWGVGQRDEGTIASYLVRKANDQDVSLQVENLSQRGLVLAEQVPIIERRLKSGRRPDLLIFHIGFNEVGVALADEMVRDGDPLAEEIVDGDQQDQTVVGRMLDQEEINRRADEFLAAEFGPRVAAAAEDAIVAAQDDIAALEARYDVPVVYFFQPDATANRHQLEPYEAISNIPTDAMAKSPLGEALAGTAERLEREGRVVDLRGVFDDVDEQVFLGLVHHNERGAEIVADAMLPTVLGELDLDDGN